MKIKTLVAVALLACCIVFLRASEDVDTVNHDADVSDFKGLVKALAIEGVTPHPSPPSKLQTIQSFIQARSLPSQVYVPAMVDVADEFLVPFTLTDGRIWPTNGRAAHFVVSTMGSLGNIGFLSWIKQQTVESQWSGVREEASIAYVKIAGLDAVPFVRKILSGSDDKYDLNCKYLVSKEFFEQITKAETAKAPQDKIDAAYGMLVEQAQTVAYVGHVDEIDKFLCKRLEGYRTSVQREKIVERFVSSANEIARANFGKKQAELQKTSKAERIDLSQRFPSLMEMKSEDEKQMEEATPAEGK